MKHYGLVIAEGSEITNPTVATGTSYPADESVGELFFRTDIGNGSLFVYTGATNGWVSAVDPGITEVIDDTSPQLGGDLDLNGFDLITEDETGTNNADSIDVLLGDGGSGGGRGGSFILRAGHSYGSYTGGDIWMFGGDANGTGRGGALVLRAGLSPSDYRGGEIQIAGGRDSASGGSITIDAGMNTQADDDVDGSLILIRSGPGGADGGGGGGAGGILQIIAGAGYGTSDGGDVVIKPGSANGSGNTGAVLIAPSGGSSIAPLRFVEASPGSHYIEIKCPLDLTSSPSWTLPDDDPATAAGKFLTTDASGVWSFAPGGGDLVDDTTPQLGGDLDTNNNDIVMRSGGTDDSIIFMYDPDGTAVEQGKISTGGGSGTGDIFLTSRNSLTIRTNTGATYNELKFFDTGILRLSNITDYETLVTDDDDIPNKKYVDDAVASGGTFAARMTIYEYTATAGQTTFSGADDNGETLTYNQGEIIVFQNGTMLDPNDYTATSGTSVVLNTGAGVGHEVNVIRYAMETSSAAQPVLYQYTATAGQTTFSGADNNGVILGYTEGELLVFKNGSLLDPTDYTATSGNSVVLDTGATAGDDVNILRFIAVERFNTLKTYRYLLDTGEDTASGTDAKGNTLSYAIGLLNVYLNGSKVSEDEYTATDGSSVVLDSAVTSDNNILEVQTFSTFTSVDEVVARENLIINGNMELWQRGTSVTSVTNNTYLADRWQYIDNGTGVLDMSRSTDAPNGSTYSVDCTVTTADASVGSGEYHGIRHAIEGHNIRDLNMGTSDAKAFTLSFYVKSSVTGIYSVGFRNGNAGGQHRSYIAEYTISAADTWEKAVITVPGDTGGNWNSDEDKGLELFFIIAGGPTFATTAGSWVDGNYINSPNQVNGIATVSNSFKLAQVRCEVGSIASSFRSRSIGEELALCQRYFQKNYDADTPPGTISSNGGVVWRTGAATTFWYYTIRFPVFMRTEPTVTFYNGTTGATGTWRGSSSTDYTITLNRNGQSAISCTTSVQTTTNLFRDGFYTADAEL